MVPVCDKRYHIYIRFCHFWAEIKKLWNYPLTQNLPFVNKTIIIIIIFFIIIIIVVIIIPTKRLCKHVWMSIILLNGKFQS